MSRHRYPSEACRLFSRTDFTKLKASLTQCRSSNDFEASEVDVSIKTCSNNSDQVKKINTSILPAKEKKASDGARSKKSTLKAILGEALSYGPALAEHIILDADLAHI
ncbi:hypothetical protein HPP92_010666 [Vanilla planifolia]|uniref:Uncharacterized protein n=1 Tax=Vanilla planifolia TaxID=51239 RepID=A0A835R9W0_VANPL|nr:hypothetical protein HPP92_010666 [Vanilla planifolia]